MKKIIFIANVDSGEGMSGGSRIYLELLKRLGNFFEIFFLGSRGTIHRLKQEDIKNISYFETDNNDHPNLYSMYGVFIHSFRRLIRGIAVIKKNEAIINQADYIYSVSDFHPDLIPALYAKLKNPKIKWIAAFYFFAASPFSSDFPYKGSGLRLRGAIYYLTQKIAYFLINRYSDFIVLCNELDKKVFVKSGYSPLHIYTIYGGVDLSEANSVSAPKVKKYDGIYMARFHPQKGPLVAVKVWEELLKKKPHARLGMIGQGSLEKEVKDYIKEKKLENNISLLGFKDGREKYKILKSAQLFLHTSIYETGGMAAAEGMAAGLPVVAFDHTGFDYCYPKGITRISPIGDIKKMAAAILTLLTDTKKYNQIKEEAMELVREEWDWDKRLVHLLAKIDTAFRSKL